MAKVIVLSGYGINCERETLNAFTVVGGTGDIVHVNDLISGDYSLDDYDILAIPGGFSYGDDTGSGNAMAWKIKLNLFDEIKKFISDGKLVIGICNGFQVLANLGLFGEVALNHNDSATYECRWVYLKPYGTSPWVKDLGIIHVPVAHGEGKFTGSSSNVAFRYCDEDGSLASGKFPLNPNGAFDDIASVTDTTGRIIGLMPHPERAIYFSNLPDFHRQKEELKRLEKEVPVYNESVLKVFRNGIGFFD